MQINNEVKEDDLDFEPGLIPFICFDCGSVLVLPKEYYKTCSNCGEGGGSEDELWCPNCKQCTNCSMTIVEGEYEAKMVNSKVKSDLY